MCYSEEGECELWRALQMYIIAGREEEHNFPTLFVCWGNKYIYKIRKKSFYSTV